MIFFCLGLPFAIWSAARTSHEGSAAHRRLVHVLTWVYNDDCWYMESLDLLRKFALSGVVSITWRDERAQLLFGCFACLVTPPREIRSARASPHGQDAPALGCNRYGI